MNVSSLPKTKWLYVPMEIVDRELYPKLLLISEAIGDGWQCVFGTKSALIGAADQLPPGVVYLKSVIPSEYDNMMRFKKYGHRLVSLDEEGLIQSSLETLVTARYCDKTVAETEKFFCWGDIQREALQERYKDYADKFQTTGSPTADLWSLKAKEVYQERVDELHARYGKYILIPSSFAVPNHFMGPEAALKIMERDNMFRDGQDYQYYKRYHDYVEIVFNTFLKFLPVISNEFPEYKIILRPHPSDNHQTWKDAAKTLDNFEVVFEGAVSPWLFGAEAILHWGSTTGLEAYMLGRPVVGHTPLPEEEKNYDVLPHLVSIMTHTQEDMIKVLRDVLETPNDLLLRYPDLKKGHEVMKRWIHNMGNPPAIRTIMDEINTMNVTEATFEGIINAPEKALQFKELIWSGIELISHIPGVISLFPEHFKIGVKSRAFGRHKTRNLTSDDIDRGLRDLDSSPWISKEIAHNLYLIRPSS